MKIEYRKSTSQIQKMHGLQDWEQMFRLEKSEMEFVIRAFVENEIVGQIAVQDEWVFFFVVDPDFRELGIGSKLLSLAEKEISKKHQFVALNVEKESEKSLIPYYTKHGYSPFIKNERNEQIMLKEVEKSK
jgi:ribosomal protein S18 acetylase RimI-like enzyme